jgi:hypothetical protein
VCPVLVELSLRCSISTQVPNRLGNLFLFSLFVLGTDPMALHMLSKPCTKEPHPQPWGLFKCPLTFYSLLFTTQNSEITEDPNIASELAPGIREPQRPKWWGLHSLPSNPRVIQSCLQRALPLSQEKASFKTFTLTSHLP